MHELPTSTLGTHWEKFWGIILSAGVAVATNIAGIRYVHNHPGCEVNVVLIWSSVISTILIAVVKIFLPYILIKFPKARGFSRYEGRWLQLIPDFERPYSIIDLTYNKKLYKYELHGINYSEDLKPLVYFDAYRIVERTFRDGFYYITNPTSLHTNGLGKVCFTKIDEDNLVRAEGYFFDSSADPVAKKHRTYLIKCDGAFYKKLDKGYNPMTGKAMFPTDVMERCKEFADDEMAKHFESDMRDANTDENCEDCQQATPQTV